MNSEHESFILYKKDIAEQIDDLSTEEKAELFTAIVYFVTGKTLPELSKVVRLVFTPIRNQLERDDEKWEVTRQKRIEAGKQGGRPPKSTGTNNSEKQTKANAFSEKQTKAKKAVYVTVDDTVNVNDNVNGNVDDINKKESKKEYKENGGRYRTYEDVFDEFGVEPTVRDKLIEFTKACYVNKHIISNDKLENIIIRLDKAYYKNETAKCRCIDRAISGGYLDIKTDN